MLDGRVLHPDSDSSRYNALDFKERLAQLYSQFVKSHNPLSPPVLLLVTLDPDSLCACRILTSLLKRDYIPHKIQPIAGYGDLQRAGEELIRPMRICDGGAGGLVICIGAGGPVDLSAILGLETEEDGSGGMSGLEIWLFDSRRPWNLSNVFSGSKEAGNLIEDMPVRRIGVDNGEILSSYKTGTGGIIVFDDGDIETDLQAERDAYCALEGMPDVDDDGEESDDSDSDNDASETPSRKRKSWLDSDDEDEDDDERPEKKRRSSTSSSIASPLQRKPRGLLSTNVAAEDLSRTASPQRSSPPEPSARTLRRRLLRMKRKHEAVLVKYYELGASYAEPVSSMMYSLASDLGREDNDSLWLAIVGVGSLELYGRGLMGVAVNHAEARGPNSWARNRGELVRQVLRDEVRRLNPPELAEVSRDPNGVERAGVIPTNARSPEDYSIRLSPEPKFLLIRHWSLYESMLHSPYLSARLQIWTDAGRKRLAKLLAKMGISLAQSKQVYTHMDMELKKKLRNMLQKYAPIYGLHDVVPESADQNRTKDGWGFVKSWGWKACLSAVDVAVILGAILEVGKGHHEEKFGEEPVDEAGTLESEQWVTRFWDAYDALDNVETLKASLPTAMQLHRAILRTGTSLLEKKQIKHLHAFRMTIVKEGPDVALFSHPSALTKLALWLGEAIAEQEKDERGKLSKGGRGIPLVVAGLNERRGVYVIVGTGGGAGRFLESEARRKEKDDKRKEKEKKRAAKRKEREERLAMRRELRDDDDENDEEEEEDVSSDDSDSDDDDLVEKESQRKGSGRNRFGHAFQEVTEETGARVRIDSFENCVAEVKKEDLAGFLEGLSMKTVVG